MYALINHVICECYTKPNYLIGLTSRTFSHITELQPASTYVVVFYRQVCVDLMIRLFMWRSRLLASCLCNFRICLSDFSPQYQYSHGDKYLCFNLVLDIFVSFYVRNHLRTVKELNVIVCSFTYTTEYVPHPDGSRRDKCSPETYTAIMYAHTSERICVYLKTVWELSF